MFRATKGNFINKKIVNMTFSFWSIKQWIRKYNTNYFECGVI